MRNLGVQTAVVDAPPSLSAPTDTTTLFVVGEAERGVLAPIRLRSIRDWASVLGARTGVAIPIYDHVDAMLREGVSEVLFSRAVGPAVATASVNLAGTTSTSLVVRASSPGEWGNGAAGGLSVEVIAGAVAANRVLIVRRGGVEVDRSVDAATRAELDTWADSSDWVDIDLGADTTMPVVAASANLAGGASDTAGITSTQVQAAADRFGRGLGPGQLYAPGRTAQSSQEALLASALPTNRVCLFDMPQGVSVSALRTQIAALRALGTGAEGKPRLAAAWAQYATIPGIVAGTTRTVGFAAIVAGLIARAERIAGHANVAPSGPLGVPASGSAVIDRYFSETDGGDADTLLEAGINVVVERFGRPRNYSFRSLDNPATSQWVDFAHSRLAMGVVAEADGIGEDFEGITIDTGAANRFGSRIRSALAEKWRDGALYGETQDEAFEVNTGPTVNTETTIAARELHAEVGLTMSEHAEKLFIEVAKVPITQEV